MSSTLRDSSTGVTVSTLFISWARSQERRFIDDQFGTTGYHTMSASFASYSFFKLLLELICSAIKVSGMNLNICNFL